MLRTLFSGGFSIDTVIYALMTIVVVILSLSVHELSHGFAAYKLGDPTAKFDGRLSLNPLHHLDTWGTLSMLFFGFGWAKPVMINPNYFKNLKRDTALVSLAGPLSNFLLAFVGMFGFLYLYPLTRSLYVFEFFSIWIIANISLGVFNMIPIPPLDGSKIFLSLLPRKMYYEILRYEQFGFIILVIALYLNVLDPVLDFLINKIYALLFYAAGGGLL
jgi:Zn-dependent protease